MSKRISFKLYKQEQEYVNSFMNQLRQEHPNELVSTEQFAKDCLLRGISSILKLGEQIREEQEAPHIASPEQEQGSYDNNQSDNKRHETNAAIGISKVENTNTETSLQGKPEDNVTVDIGKPGNA